MCLTGQVRSEQGSSGPYLQSGEADLVHVGHTVLEFDPTIDYSGVRDHTCLVPQTTLHMTESYPEFKPLATDQPRTRQPLWGLKASSSGSHC